MPIKSLRSKPLARFVFAERSQAATTQPGVSDRPAFPFHCKISRADVVGVDLVSGLGLLRAAEVLPVKPMPIGTAHELVEKTPVVVAGSGGIEAAQPAVVVSRRAFAGYWEYLLDDAIFTAPLHPAWSGAALLAPDGRLAGIGSLFVGDAKARLPGNMFVPIDHLRPVMGDLLALPLAETAIKQSHRQNLPSPKSSSHRTPRWRKPDPNHRSRVTRPSFRRRLMPLA